MPLNIQHTRNAQAISQRWSWPLLNMFNIIATEELGQEENGWINHHVYKRAYTILETDQGSGYYLYPGESKEEAIEWFDNQHPKGYEIVDEVYIEPGDEVSIWRGVW